MKVGVFDSGIGGLSVVNAIKRSLPAVNITFVTDAINFPYASKSPDDIWRGIVPIFEKLIKQDVDVIVVACNTVSTTLGSRLRAEFPLVPMVMLDPMVKPAAKLTTSGIIAVCATPTTLASERYATLKRECAASIRIIEPDCSNWSQLIENNQMNEAELSVAIEPVLGAGADVIVLACTHYHWIEQQIIKLANNRAVIVQPEEAITHQLKRVLAQSA